jgi:hypothetical protein
MHHIYREMVLRSQLKGQGPGVTSLPVNLSIPVMYRAACNGESSHLLRPQVAREKNMAKQPRPNSSCEQVVLVTRTSGQQVTTSWQLCIWELNTIPMQWAKVQRTPQGWASDLRSDPQEAVLAVLAGPHSHVVSTVSAEEHNWDTNCVIGHMDCRSPTLFLTDNNKYYMNKLTRQLHNQNVAQ